MLALFDIVTCYGFPDLFLYLTDEVFLAFCIICHEESWLFNLLLSIHCLWSDPCYVIFHDEEWGVPVHDDRYEKLWIHVFFHSCYSKKLTVWECRIMTDFTGDCLSCLYCLVHWPSSHGLKFLKGGNFSGMDSLMLHSRTEEIMYFVPNICAKSSREIFVDFDPVAISKINEKKLVAPGSVANSLLSEQKLRAVVENARQILKVRRHAWSYTHT